MAKDRLSDDAYHPLIYRLALSRMALGHRLLPALKPEPNDRFVR